MIQISAESQLAAAIPPVMDSRVQTDATYKQYQDQPELENLKSDLGITGVRRESSAIVPSEEGEIVFPEQVIHWWDLNAKRWREAVLAEERYLVAPAATGQSFTSPVASTNPVLLDNNQDILLRESNGRDAGFVNRSLWQWASIILAVIVVVQSIFLFRARGSGAITPQKPKTSLSDSEKQAWQRLQSALTSKNAREIRAGIISWSQHRWPNEMTHSLSTLSAKSSSQAFGRALEELDLILFKGASMEPNLPALQSELKKLRAAPTGKIQQSELNPLYPNS